VPHGIVPPHPSGTLLQFITPQLPVGVQPQMPDAPHVVGAVHVPQCSVPPQPSGQSPQLRAPHVDGVQPQTFGVPPPPHVAPVAVHVPQASVPPQPSGIDPQSLPAAVQVVAVQPHTFGTPPPPHV
jgi:hypothetical protein